MAACRRLTRIDLLTMKGPTELTPLLTAPALTPAEHRRDAQLQPADVAVLAAHPTSGSSARDWAAAARTTNSPACYPYPRSTTTTDTPHSPHNHHPPDQVVGRVRQQKSAAGPGGAAAHR